MIWPGYSPKSGGRWLRTNCCFMVATSVRPGDHTAHNVVSSGSVPGKKRPNSVSVARIDSTIKSLYTDSLNKFNRFFCKIPLMIKSMTGFGRVQADFDGLMMVV